MEGNNRRWWILVVLCLSLIVIMVDNTIVNVALPTLQDKLPATPSQLQWIVDSYILVFAGLLLTTGTLSDRYGRAHALAVGLIIFGIGSGLSAWAPSASWLIADRAIMGLGGALIMPSTLSIITNVFPPHERGRAFGIWAGMSAAGIGIGPVVGGWLLQPGRYWWGSIFLVNIPVVVVALIAGRLIVPNSRDPETRPVDLPGVGLSIVGLVSLVYAIVEAPTHGWTSGLILGAAALAVVVLAAFVAWEFHTDHPMLNLSFFANPRFTAANLSITLVFFALMGSLFLLTQHLQFVLGYSPLSAGLRVAPMALVMMVLSPVVGRLVEQVGNKLLVAGGLVIAAVGLFYLSRISAADGYGPVLVGLIALALAIALAMVPATESIMGSLPLAQAGLGSAMNDTTRQLGAALGVAVMGSIGASAYSSYIRSHLPGMPSLAKTPIGRVIRTAGGGGTGQHVVEVAKAAFVHGMSRGLAVGAVVALAGAVVAAVWLPTRARARAAGLEHRGLPEGIPAEPPVPVGTAVAPGGDDGRSEAGHVALTPRLETPGSALEGVPAGALQVRPPGGEDEGLQTTEPLYDGVESWVVEWFAPTFGPRIRYDQWCPRWWEHAEAVLRLEALWRAWELLRLDSALGMATWLRDYLEPEWDLLMAATRPLEGCEVTSMELSRDGDVSISRPLSTSIRTDVS
jgi:EmrB/QacA subfamily drug resistance transporter